MWCWANSEESILTLKSISPRKGMNNRKSINNNKKKQKLQLIIYSFQ